MRRAASPGLGPTAEALLRDDRFEARLAAWDALPAARAVRPLLSFLCSPEEVLRWRAVRALGVVVSRLAGEDPEAARVVMRKLMWSLAEESGAFGWGAPEAMAEIMARHAGLAAEFGHVLLSYLREDGQRLDSEVLLRGVVWGLGRLARARPGVLPECARHLEPFLRSGDPALRGMAAWALSGCGWTPSPAQAEAIRADDAEFPFYRGGALVACRVRDAPEAGDP